MTDLPNTYRAAGLWKIDDVMQYKNNNEWPTATSSGDLNCYSYTPIKRECGDCIAIGLDGVVASGTIIDPNNSSLPTGLGLPKKAWVVNSDGWGWDDWWYYGYNSWNRNWRYGWYDRWWNYGWYWGWGCYRYWWSMDNVSLFNINCSGDTGDQYPVCGTGTPVPTGFSWGDTFYTYVGGFTPSSSGLIPTNGSFSYSYNDVTPGSTNSTVDGSVYIPTNSSGVIPWNLTWNYAYNQYSLNKGIYLGVGSWTRTYEGVVNTGNTNNTNAFNVVFSSGTNTTSNGYRSWYYGALQNNDPIWSNLSWKSGYPAALTGVNKFWFAVTQKDTTVSSGFMDGFMYDSNGSGYPLYQNYGTRTYQSQVTRFYQYNNCQITDITDLAISGNSLQIGLYNPNKRTVNPLNYIYEHRTANVCDASYTMTNWSSLYSLYKTRYDAYIGDGIIGGDEGSCAACLNEYGGLDYDLLPGCLSGCSPGTGYIPPTNYGGLTCSDEYNSLYSYIYWRQFIDKDTNLISINIYPFGNDNSYSATYSKTDPYNSASMCTNMSSYDSDLYYGYHFGTYPGTGVYLSHPKIAWAIGDYTINADKCSTKTPVSGQSWTSFAANALETIVAYSPEYDPYYYYFPFGGWLGGYAGYGWCRPSFCLNQSGQLTSSWSYNSFLAIDDDCYIDYDNDYSISQTYCGICTTNKTVVDASGIISFSPSGSSTRNGSSINIDKHCYYYQNPYTYQNKTIQLYYEPVSGIIPIINGKAYDTDGFYSSGNYIINLTGISLTSTKHYWPVYNFISNNLIFATRTSGTGSGSVFNYNCSAVNLYWPYCSGSNIPIKIVPAC